jgi:hypothetical protein
MIITRRKFFSFFGTGVVMAAKPELAIPKTDAITVTISNEHVFFNSPEGRAFKARMAAAYAKALRDANLMARVYSGKRDFKLYIPEPTLKRWAVDINPPPG